VFDPYEYRDPNPRSVYAEECPCANDEPERCTVHPDPSIPPEPDPRFVSAADVARDHDRLPA
jgi:hypothetical protein